MALANQQTTRDLAEVLLGDARNYSFYRLLEHLHKLHDDNLEALNQGFPEDQHVRLESDAGLGFPASDVTRADYLADDASDRYRIQTTFFSLQGPDSPLPCYYLNTLAYAQGQDIGIRPAFLNFFNHRLLTLLHRSWRKYRYYVRFQNEARDRFSRYVFSLIGLNDKELRGATPIAWRRLLSYAGLIASRSRSPAVVAGIVAHCFDLPAVHIREFDQRYVEIQPEQHNALGARNMSLGDNFVVGAGQLAQQQVHHRHSTTDAAAFP